MKLGFSASTKDPALAIPHRLGRKCLPRNHKPAFPTAQAAGTGGVCHSPLESLAFAQGHIKERDT